MPRCACPPDGSTLCPRCQSLLDRAQQGPLARAFEVLLPEDMRKGITQRPSVAQEIPGGKTGVSGAGKAGTSTEAPEGQKQGMPCEVCFLSLPYPPSINRYWATVGKRRVITKEGRLYRQAAIEQIAQQRRAVCPWPLRGRLEVTLRLHAPDQRAQDIDNRVKVALDLLQQGKVITNDNQIDALHIYRERMTTGGRVEVELKPY